MPDHRSQQCDVRTTKIGTASGESTVGQKRQPPVNLNLFGNQITISFGIKLHAVAFVGALVNNVTAALSIVTHINLIDNFLPDEGASFLAETL
jgi:hypothetical protein